MGKHLWSESEDELVEVNCPSCMRGIIHALDWHNSVKKVYPTKSIMDQNIQKINVKKNFHVHFNFLLMLSHSYVRSLIPTLKLLANDLGITFVSFSQVIGYRLMQRDKKATLVRWGQLLHQFQEHQRIIF
ncbi:uncharacterized protein LOC114265398 [Camellia sinensis]|uniref:uncharacterized protein LOC114265398 n=1 Tax=Camellia sinensis TaxID=4442 RepID=UPI0010367FD3|nr:uncharacterized protein LOC114265398 [Camellia sinensis]XP_028062026.1 uncharacterized protein LOC114265398 [Camellia sinensis]